MISSTSPRCNYPLDLTETLRNWANSPQAEKDLETVFGQALHWPAAYRHLDAFRRGDFSLLPPIEVLEDAAMPGLWGGYSRDLRLVFLSADCPEDLIVPVLLEEIGHFFDQEFCKEETPGDEGVVFSALVLGNALNSREAADDDLWDLQYAGVSVAVEAAPKVRGSAKTKPVAQPKVRGKTSSKVVSDTTTSQDGTVVYANKDSVRLVQTKANQRVIGSKGNDTFVVKSQDVRLEDPNGGTDTVETSVSFSLSNFSFIENLAAVSGTAAVSLTGNAKANIITGNSGNNVLDGGLDSQKDTLIGGAGNDTYIIRDSLDVISDSSGTDVIFTTNQSLSLSSYTNIESIVFIGTDGADSMIGGAGAGTLMGGRGNDTYFVDNALDSVSETDSLTLTGGVDWVNTRINYALGSNVENLFKTGNANASLTGNTLGNIIDGSAGGVNTLSGGAGNDTLIVNTARYGSIAGGADTDILRLVGTSLIIRNPAFAGIETLDLSLLAGSASVTLNSLAGGLETLIASSFNDTIDASAFGQEIWIDASASSGARLIGSTTAPAGNTLIGGANGGNNFVLNQIGTNSLVGGIGGLDTLTLTNSSALSSGAFASLSGIGTLILAENTNVTLGTDALDAGIRTLVGGVGVDDGTGNTFNTSAYGSAGVLFQVTDQDYLSNVTAIIGSAGVDTLKFSRDGVSVTDENVARLTDIDVLRTANGNNHFLIHNAFVVAGIDSIIGGTGRDTINMSDNAIYTPTGVADMITMDMSAGSGYTLISSTDDFLTLIQGNFRWANVIGGSVAGSVILDGTNLADADFENMYQANIGTLFMRWASDNTVVLGEDARGTGLDTLSMSDGDDNIDVTDFLGTLAVNGGDGDDIVRTSFAALSDLTYTGGGGVDTLRLTGAEARSITSLAGNFEALALNAGNNFVILANDASLSAIHGGTGIDTISMLNNTTGINFVMNAARLSNTAGFASLDGGEGSDTLSVNNVDAGGFLDNQFARVGSVNWAGDLGAIENFETEDGRALTYAFGTNAYAAGIQTVYAHPGDNLNAAAFEDPDPAITNDRALNFVFDTAAGLASANITGTGATANDTLTLTTDAQTVTDTTFANHSSVETLVLANGANSVTLDSDAQTAGIKTVIGGTGIDQFTKINATVTTLVGGSGNDVFNYSTKAIFAADSLDGGTGSNSIIFSTDAQIFIDTDFDRITASTIQSITTANGANNLTLGANAVAAGIATVTGGTGDDTFDATAYTIASTLSGGDGNDSLLSGTGNDSLTGGNGTDWLQGTSASSKGVGQFDTLTGGAGIDTFILGDSGFAYYNSTEADTPVDYAVITDFAIGDLLQLKTIDNLEAGNGYIVLGVGGSKYQLYLDTDKSDAYNSGDNLIAEITSSVALTTVNLKSTHGSFV